MKNILRKTYKRLFSDSFREFIWRRIHDARFIWVIISRFPKSLYFKINGAIDKAEGVIEPKVIESILHFETIDDVKVLLNEGNIAYEEGEFALYISNQSDIDSLFPGLTLRYPYRFGVKLIKSQVMSDDGTPFYCGYDASRTSTHVIMRAVGSANDKKIISNILSEFNVAPRVYDLVKIVDKNRQIHCLIVEHIDGNHLEGKAGSEFLNNFFGVLEQANIDFLGGRKSGDFSPPYFGRNIISDSNNTYYVDIQNFRLKDQGVNDSIVQSINNETHFGESSFLRSRRYSYQSVPELKIHGKRDSLIRLDMIDGIIKGNNIELSDSVILDVGCNLGLFLRYSIMEGAQWVVGLDMPEVTKVERNYMYRRGFSNFDILGCDLTQKDHIVRLPYKKYHIVFYMSIEGHIGFPEWLEEISFDYMLYEGHEGESVINISDKIMSSRLDVEILDKSIIRDGDSLSRPMLLCKVN